MKKQIWLRPDQTELVIAALVNLKIGAQEFKFTSPTEHHRAACLYTTHQIDDVFKLLGVTQ